MVMFLQRGGGDIVILDYYSSYTLILCNRIIHRIDRVCMVYDI